MKYLTTMRHRYLYRASWTNFTNGGANADVKQYDPTPSGVIEFAGGLGPGENLVIYCAQPLRLFVRLDNVTDKHGNLLFPVDVQPQGATYEVRSCQPRLNTDGTVEGYRMNITKII